MKRIRIKSATVAGIALASAGVVALGFASPAGAYTGSGFTQPVWANSTSATGDPAAVGGIAFFNASGTQIFSGPTNSAPFAKYSVGLAVPHTGDTAATLYAYVPQTSSPQLWSTFDQVSQTTTYPVSGAPSPVGGTSLPVSNGQAIDNSLETVAGPDGYPPPSGVGTDYNNYYELRLYTAGSHGQSINYDYAVISVNFTTHTWTEVYSPDQVGVSTTTAVSHSPTTGITDQSTVNLTATVTASDSTTPKGTVQFYDGGTSNPIGTPVTVQSNGTATFPYVNPSSGPHSITATFTPATLSGYNTSTSSPADTFSATHQLATSNTTLGVDNNNPHQGDVIHFTATVTPSSATGTVALALDGTTIATHSVGTGGIATFTVSTGSWSVGPHNLVATYSGDSNNTGSSSSPATPVTVQAPSGAQDVQYIEADVAAGSIAITTPYDSTHPLNLNTLTLDPTGHYLTASAAFGDGSVVGGGTANTGLTGAGINPGAGTGDIQIVDTRSGNPGWTASATTTGLTTTAAPIGSEFTSINGENVGLTFGANAIDYVSGNAITSAHPPVLTDNPAANLPVNPSDTGDLGLGGGTTGQPGSPAHEFAAADAGFGTGTVGFHGTLTVTAPTSTEAGHYTGTITFTVV